MGRIFCISLKRFVILFLLVIVVVAGVFWAFQKINAHKLWASMLRESQRLRTHLDAVYVLLPAKFNGSLDPTTSNWLNAELVYATSSLTELINLDQGHQVQLGKILYLIDTIRGPNIDLSWLNSTEQSRMMNTIHDIGQKVAQAYWSILNYTSVDSINGPPFWYFGPAPPNETILEEAAQLALNLTEEIKQI
ncbi:hypothetical protein KEJ24_06110 [Candidatus Bathyarchaeota archaeon]|nr:hypothetical protein [Candidatus Bathyarchaeota archaeon]